MKKSNSSTIVAQATASGASAISIIRFSGPQAYNIAQKIWQPISSHAPSPRELTLGWLVDGITKIDQAMLVYMPAPHSYTGEDVVEIHTHGAPVITQTVISLALKHGAQLAEPGEFTRRAFLNGKLDLTQAEAVGELIASNNATMMRLASKQLAGGLSEVIDSIKKTLLGLAAHEAASLDFSEEDIIESQLSIQEKSLKKITKQASDLLSNSSSLAIVKNGYSVALVGLPNAGKSTLLNTLLGYDRSIVTDIAGTTRDTITEGITLGDISIHLTDTAGLRDASDKVEQLGVDRTLQELKSSDTIIILIEPDMMSSTISYLKKNNILPLLNTTSSLIVFTKSDIDQHIAVTPKLNSITQLTVSAKTGNGITGLKKQLQAFASQNQSSENLSVLTNRQIELIKKLTRQLKETLQLVQAQTPADIILVEYQNAISICNSLTGEEVTQEIINKVFSDFCIGK